MAFVIALAAYGITKAVDKAKASSAARHQSQDQYLHDEDYYTASPSRSYNSNHSNPSAPAGVSNPPAPHAPYGLSPAELLAAGPQYLTSRRERKHARRAAKHARKAHVWSGGAYPLAPEHQQAAGPVMYEVAHRHGGGRHEEGREPAPAYERPARRASMDDAADRDAPPEYDEATTGPSNANGRMSGRASIEVLLPERKGKL